jgi:hypothetical protein
MKNRKPETENGKPEIGPDRFSFPVSCFRFSVSGFFPVWFALVRVRSGASGDRFRNPQLPRFVLV